MKMHPYQLIAGFLGFLLVTSKEIIWLRPWIGDQGFNYVVTALFALHFLSLFTHYNRERANITFRPSLRWRKWPGMQFLLIVCLSYMTYFLFHEIYVGDSSRCLKYAMYVLFLASLLCTSYDLENIPRIFVALSLITSVMIVIQSLLIQGLLDNNLMGQPRVFSVRADGAMEFNEANPFWLGLISDNSLVDYGIMQFRRANAYTTEPKYCSQVLIAAMVSLAAIPKITAHKRKLASIVLGLGLLASHAYSTLPVLFLAYLIYQIGRSRHAFIYSLVTLGVIVGSIVLLSTVASSFRGYAGERVGSFLVQTDMMAEVMTSQPSPIGFGVEDVRTKRAGLPPIPRFLIQIGWIGLAFEFILLFTVLSKALRGIYLSRDPHVKWALALAASLSLLFSSLFNSEPISPLYSYLFAIVFHLSGNLELAVKKAKVPMRAVFGKLTPDYSF